ncbi:MAG: hypothetical protein KAT16_02560 [Candidatus Heimdallarchaeota archaeon]|nr:hypothetical protein [Candidatus Heimdallarchaeota archaeon]
MDDKQLESLVVQQVRNVLQNNKPLGSYNVLGILTHMGQGIDDLFNSLVNLAKNGQKILVWTTEEINESLEFRSRINSVPTLDVISSTNGSFCLTLLDKLEYIIFGGFSFEIAAGLVRLEDSDTTVNILLQGIIAKKPVYIITPFTKTDLNFEFGPSGILTKELSKRLSDLIEMGFRLVDVRDLTDQFIKHTPQTPDLITEGYLETLKGKTKELHIPHSTIITPLAQEKAKDLNIKIIKV